MTGRAGRDCPGEVLFFDPGQFERISIAMSSGRRSANCRIPMSQFQARGKGLDQMFTIISSKIRVGRKRPQEAGNRCADKQNESQTGQTAEQVSDDECTEQKRSQSNLSGSCGD